MKNNLNMTLKLKSIEHWNRVLDLTSAQIQNGEECLNDSNCAFCNEYLFSDNDGCGQCPITLKTGLPVCEGTPYTECYKLYVKINNYFRDPSTLLKEFKIKVKEEIAFIESLEV